MVQLDLSEDQVLLHDTTVRFIEAELPIGQTRLLHDDPNGYDRGWLQKAAGLGWFAMLVPEADGGGCMSGDGLADAAIIAEELGRHLQPGPFVPMNVVAAAVAAHGSAAARADLLPELVAGETVATWALSAMDGSVDDGAGVGFDGSALTGSRGYVQDVASADVMLVSAERDGEPVQVLVPTAADGIELVPLDSLDRSRRFAHVHLDRVQVDADAVLGGGAAGLEAALLTAVVLNLADTVGAIDRLFEMTVAYAKDRVAFGRPIGSFQAIKHILADQALYLETCRAGAAAAAKAVSAGDERASEVVSMTAAYIGDVANDIAQECLQVHGGIGYTWEHDLHLFLRRVRSNAAVYGEPSWHRERVCTWYGLGEER